MHSGVYQASFTGNMSKIIKFNMLVYVLSAGSLLRRHPKNRMTSFDLWDPDSYVSAGRLSILNFSRVRHKTWSFDNATVASPLYQCA
jgi:hypothetical protein